MDFRFSAFEIINKKQIAQNTKFIFKEFKEITKHVFSHCLNQRHLLTVFLIIQNKYLPSKTNSIINMMLKIVIVPLLKQKRPDLWYGVPLIFLVLIYLSTGSLS